MNRKAKITILTLIISISVAGAVIAGTVKCVIDSIDGETVTMTCKKSDKLKEGQKVKVKPVKKKAIEGC